MDKNTLIAVVVSTVFLIFWWTYFQPKPVPKSPVQTAAQSAEIDTEKTQPETAAAAPVKLSPGKETVFETDKYRAVFTSKGGAIKEWWLKEKNGSKPVNLALYSDSRFLSTFPETSFSAVQRGKDTIIFEGILPSGARIKKTYTLADDYLNKLEIELSGGRKSGDDLSINLGPGIGTDVKELKENLGLMRALAFRSEKPKELKVLKPGEYPAGEFKWVAIDNRYFLSSLIPGDDNGFDSLIVKKSDKKAPSEIFLVKRAGKPVRLSLQFYLGPKGHGSLKYYKLGLEEAVDFGFFGFLGKMALAALSFFYKITGNYGWGIILLTIMLQILVYPLSLKSFKSSAAMKKLQPKMKEIQTKFKDDQKRLNMEMMNLYKSEGFNPLGGCLPMILQLPIFWALFTTLRNAYELRGAPWIWWIKDLSSADRLFSDLLGLPFTVGLLPILMGLGMLVQQKMTSASSDPSQAMMMYMLPVVFTFMFMGFPSGLVLYWLVNSLMTMVEMYFILHLPEKRAAKASAKMA
ncbi:MAG: membrane protein insertase YidC [Elusimicrobiota bacterium]